MQWHGRTLHTVDTHADSLGATVRGERRVTERAEKGQLDLPRMREAGHTLQFFSCFVEPDYKPERSLSRLLQYIDTFWEEVGQDPEAVAVTGRASLERLLTTPGGVGGAISVEGAEALATDEFRLRTLWRLGVRLLSFTWNQRNDLADGAGEDPGGGGLSRAGRTMVQAMNRMGMVLDVSHIAEQGFWDIMEVAEAAPIASHSNCRALCDHRRNLSDAQVRALAEKGGVQGLAFVTDFLGGAKDLARVGDHVFHHLEVVGNDRHLGLGSDFDGVEEYVAGLEDVTRLPALLDHLSQRGLSDDTIARLAGQNYLDFLHEAWPAGSE
jgi:membrane dipeptidase